MLAVALALTLGGCGKDKTAAELHLERGDLAAVAHALAGEAVAVHRETAAARSAWTHIFAGLPLVPGEVTRATVQHAAKLARAVGTDSLFSETQSAVLTGPGASLAGELHSASLLLTRGWHMINAAIGQLQHGSPTGARFARTNVALYIECVYDAHFTFAHLGKQIASDYEKLGGPETFGATLTRSEVDALADSYSEARTLLYRHETVKLGS